MGTPHTAADAPSFWSATPSAVLAFPHNRGGHHAYALQPALPAQPGVPARSSAGPEVHGAAGNIHPFSQHHRAMCNLMWLQAARAGGEVGEPSEPACC